MRDDVKRIAEEFSYDIISAEEKLGEWYISVKKESLPRVMEFVKRDKELQYTYFSECLGVDYSEWKGKRDFKERFEVVYNIMSPVSYRRLFIKVGVDDGEKVPTLKHVFAGAEFPEREVWDLFGVEFEGNEQTERFLLPDDWVGYPLRKEFPLGGENVVFAEGTLGPAIEDNQRPHAGESFEGKTGMNKRV